MSKKRRSVFLKELRRNKQYMKYIHTSMLNSRFAGFIAVLCILFTVAEYHTGGAFSGFIVALLIYLLNYIAVLYTASPVFAMRGKVMQKVIRGEYVDYMVENNLTVRSITVSDTGYDIGDEVFLYRFKPCFFFSMNETGIAPAGR